MEHQGDAPLELVIEAARLFNQLGYDVAALDLVQRELRVRASSDPSTEHLLNDREALAIAAFDYAVEQTNSMLYAAVDGAIDSAGALSAFIATFRLIAEETPIEGGCPVFNAALQSAGALPFLEDRTRNTVSEWRRQVRQIVRRGIQLGEIHPAADAEEVASIIVGTMEGAIFLHRIYNDPSHLDRSVSYLERYLEEAVRHNAQS